MRTSSIVQLFTDSTSAAIEAVNCMLWSVATEAPLREILFANLSVVELVPGGTVEQEALACVVTVKTVSTIVAPLLLAGLHAYTVNGIQRAITKSNRWVRCQLGVTNS